MCATPGIAPTLIQAMTEALQDPLVERTGFCDLRRKSWTLQGSGVVDDTTGSLWQALGDCYTVLNLQRLPCRHVHWVLDTGSVAGVHHDKVGTVGLVTRSHLPTEAFEKHMSRFEAALKEVGG